MGRKAEDPFRVDGKRKGKVETIHAESYWIRRTSGIGNSAGKDVKTERLLVSAELKSKMTQYIESVQHKLSDELENQLNPNCESFKD